jgi:LDH2 family malate/lactate/ureidoglycolate dehydrogenase
MPIFPLETLERLTREILQTAQVPSAEAGIVARHLVEANLAGHDSHGVLRIPQYVEAVKSGRVCPTNHPRVVSDHGCTAVLDGQMGFGQVIAKEAVELAMSKARSSGIAAISFSNSYHTGRIASYTLMAAREGFAAIAMVNAGGGGQSVTPFCGTSRRLATNPLSIAAPSGKEHPVVLDIATSVAPEGKLRDFWMKKKQVPAGWIIDADGCPTTNPNDFYASPGGALLPLGASAGHKGFGLAFMVDVLAGALSGAGCCRSEVCEPKDGLLMIVLDIAKFVPPDVFKAQVLQLIEHVKSCPAAPGFTEVYVPGEVEFREELKRRSEGIFLDDFIWAEICNTAHELGYRLPGSNEASAAIPLDATALALAAQV